MLSPNSVGSQNVLDEVGLAIDRQALVVPVLHRLCELPLRLRRLQYVDFSRDYDNLVANGVRIVREPAEFDYGTVAVFEDLYGNLWDLIGPPPAEDETSSR